MNASSVYYQKQSADELHSINRKPQNLQKKRLPQILAAALPILMYARPLAAPLAVGLGSLRSVKHLFDIVQAIRRRDVTKFSLSSFQLLISLTAMAFMISSLANRTLNPILSPLLSRVDMIITSLRKIANKIKARDFRSVTENCIFLASSSLHIPYISLGGIEFLTSAMALQMAFYSYKALISFKNGHYIEGVCHLICGVATAKLTLPNVKAVFKKWEKPPVVDEKSSLKLNKKLLFYSY
jgi:hypothetical protein